jgi:hypothetical protein
MKIETYTSTPGLDHYTQDQRFAAWRAAHRQLMADSGEYRKRYHSYLTAIICLSCLVPVSFAGGWLIGLVLELPVACGMVCAIVYLAFRQQHFMNQSIGHYFQSGGIA